MFASLNTEKKLSESDIMLRELSEVCKCPGCWNSYVEEMVLLNRTHRNQFVECCSECYEELQMILNNMGFSVIGRRKV